jgi:hypothetical protein
LAGGIAGQTDGCVAKRRLLYGHPVESLDPVRKCHLLFWEGSLSATEGSLESSNNREGGFPWRNTGISSVSKAGAKEVEALVNVDFKSWLDMTGWA